MRFNNGKFQKILNLENQIRGFGHKVVSVWECENPELSRRHLQREFIPYPHYIVYDIGALLKIINLPKMLDLMIDYSHISINVAINDSLTMEPVFTEKHDPE